MVCLTYSYRTCNDQVRRCEVATTWVGSHLWGKGTRHWVSHTTRLCACARPHLRDDGLHLQGWGDQIGGAVADLWYASARSHLRLLLRICAGPGEACVAYEGCLVADATLHLRSLGRMCGIYNDAVLHLRGHFSTAALLAPPMFLSHLQHLRPGIGEGFQD